MPDNPAHPATTPNPDGLDEFGVISRFFTTSSNDPRVWPSQGVGDDCAFLDLGGSRIAVTTDMMALGTHFLADADPYAVGRKALAVNLSDLAAAGADPQAFFLSISLPAADPVWLAGFSRGLLEEADRYHCALRGGDTVKAPLIDGKPSMTTISICALGALALNRGLTRKGAQIGDDVWVSGTPGDAFAALGEIWGYWKCSPEAFRYFKSRMDLPTPRVALGCALLDLAHAACDISDGLVGDLKHILTRSGVSAELDWAAFPLSESMRTLSEDIRRRCVLSGGDDYELLFTAPEQNRGRIEALGNSLGVALTRIGRIVSADKPYVIRDDSGQVIETVASFNHFGNRS